MTLTGNVTGELTQLLAWQRDVGQTRYVDASKIRGKTMNVAFETRLSTPGGNGDKAREESQQGVSLRRGLIVLSGDGAVILQATLQKSVR